MVFGDLQRLNWQAVQESWGKLLVDGMVLIPCLHLLKSYWSSRRLSMLSSLLICLWYDVAVDSYLPYMKF